MSLISESKFREVHSDGRVASCVFTSFHSPKRLIGESAENSEGQSEESTMDLNDQEITQSTFDLQVGHFAK